MKSISKRNKFLCLVLMFLWPIEANGEVKKNISLTTYSIQTPLSSKINLFPPVFSFYQAMGEGFLSYLDKEGDSHVFGVNKELKANQKNWIIKGHAVLDIIGAQGGGFYSVLKTNQNIEDRDSCPDSGGDSYFLFLQKTSDNNMVNWKSPFSKICGEVSEHNKLVVSLLKNANQIGVYWIKTKNNTDVTKEVVWFDLNGKEIIGSRYLSPPGNLGFVLVNANGEKSEVVWIDSGNPNNIVGFENKKLKDGYYEAVILEKKLVSVVNTEMGPRIGDVSLKDKLMVFPGQDDANSPSFSIGNVEWAIGGANESDKYLSIWNSSDFEGRENRTAKANQFDLSDNKMESFEIDGISIKDNTKISYLDVNSFAVPIYNENQSRISLLEFGTRKNGQLADYRSKPNIHEVHPKDGGKSIIGFNDNCPQKKEQFTNPKFMIFQRVLDSNYGRLNWCVEGEWVRGTYFFQGQVGRIVGSISDKTMSLLGTWALGPDFSPPERAGDLEFKWDEEEQLFRGRWRNGYDGYWHEDWFAKPIDP